MLVNYYQGGTLDVLPHALLTPAFEAPPHRRGYAILAREILPPTARQDHLQDALDGARIVDSNGLDASEDGRHWRRCGFAAIGWRAGGWADDNERHRTKGGRRRPHARPAGPPSHAGYLTHTQRRAQGATGEIEKSWYGLNQASTLIALATRRRYTHGIHCCRPLKWCIPLSPVPRRRRRLPCD
jgi:hypothetical protein